MDIRALIYYFLHLVNDSLIPFLLLVALLIFLWNVARYFIIGGSNESSQEKARSIATWGIAAFVVLTSIWGIVNILIYTFNFDNRGIIPDYMCEKLEDGSCRDGSRGIFNSGYGDDDIRTDGGLYRTDPGRSYGVSGRTDL